MAKFLIIGADAAGLSAAGQIKQRDPAAEIKIVNKGGIISYGACGMPYVISGEIDSPQSLIHFTPESFATMRGIPIRTYCEAVDLDPNTKSVKLLDLQTGETETESYDKLLIATGAAPVRLPFVPSGLEGIFNFHNIEDLNLILEFLQQKKPKRAVIIGAGNIGLELTEVLAGRGIEVFLIELLPEPAGPWPPLVRKAVAEKIVEKKISFLPGTRVEGIEKKGTEFRIATDQRELEADIIFSVVGTRPATEFCGDHLEKFPNGAIVIDRKGESSIKNIYAAGDCATCYHRLLDRQVYFPLGSTANKMGRIAGINLAGGDFAFPGIVGTQILKFFELSLAKTGISREEAEKEGISAKSFSARRTDKAGYYPGADPVKVQVVCDQDSGRILGACAVCEGGNAAHSIDPAAVAVFTGMNISDLGWFDSAYAPPYAPVWNALISAALKAAK